MTSLRRFTTDDLFTFNRINLDVLTETVRARQRRARTCADGARSTTSRSTSSTWAPGRTTAWCTSHLRGSRWAIVRCAPRGVRAWWWAAADALAGSQSWARPRDWASNGTGT